MTLRGVAVDAPGELPGLIAINGRAETRGSDTTVFADSSAIDGFPALRMAPATIRFHPAETAAGHEIEGLAAASVEGPVSDLLQIVARKPIDGLRSFPVAPADAAGRARVVGSLSLLLGDAIPEKEAVSDWAVAIDLTDVALAQPFQGRRIGEANGQIQLFPGSASGALKAAVDGVPAALSFVRPFGPKPEGQKSLRIESTIAAGDAIRLAPGVAGIFDGTVKATGPKAGDSVAADEMLVEFA